VKLSTLSKPLLFLVCGAIGSLLGWAVAEVIAASSDDSTPPEPMKLVTEISPGVFRRNVQASAGPPSLLFESKVQNRLVAAGANMNGDIMAALSWESVDDLDLHCVDPYGARIFFRRKFSRSRGELDVDQNAAAPYRDDPIEHIYWPLNSAPEGRYRFQVDYFSNHSQLAAVPFKLQVQIGDQIVTRTGTLSVPRTRNNDTTDPLEVFTFEYQKPVVDLSSSNNISGIISGMASVSLTLAFLALGASVIISLIQQRLLGYDGIIPRGFGRILFMSLATGVVSGSVGQAMLYMITSPAVFAGQIKIIAWIVAGGLIGLGFSFIIPNLDRGRAIIFGLIGGLISGILISKVFVDSPTIGRLTACLFLGGSGGLSVAIVEAMAREGYLNVIWGPGEFTTVNLGATPVTVGTDSQSTIKIPKSSGYPALIATFSMVDGRASMLNNMTGVVHPLRDGNKLPLGTVTIEVKLFS
jgi:hypothetical protein